MNLHTPRFEELEARILYSADALPGLVGFAPGVVEERHLLDSGEFAQAAMTQAESADIRREVVFIDTGVPDWDLLLQDIRNGQTEDRQIDVLLIDAQRDGLEQVSQALAGRNDVAALHFITHGEPGALHLGNRSVDLALLHDASETVAQWGHALTESADILLYGCDVAAGERGEAFVQTLARLTGADIAASETATGAASQGGDWRLEINTGAIESAVAVSADGQRAWGALLQSSPQGGETLVNTTTAGIQESNTNMPPRIVAMDGSGNFVVVWHGEGSGDVDGIYGQRFNAAGVAQGAEFRVNTGVAGIQGDPTLAMDANGNFVVAWSSSVGDGSGQVVFAQRYDSNGVAQGGEFRVNTTTLNDQGQPVIAMNLNGFVIAWSDSAQDGNLHGVLAQRYDAAGVAQGGEFVVTATTAGDQWIDSAAMDTSGNFIVTWSTAQDGSGLGVYSRRFDSSGTPLTGEVQVNSTTAGEQSWSSVAMNGSGAYVVTWRHHDGVNHDIHAQRYDAAGVAQGAEFRVNTTAATDQWPASVAIDGNGNFVATWSSFDQDAAGTWGIYKQEYFANGTSASAETLVTTTTAGEQDWSGIAMNASGAYVVAWSGNGAGDADGIYFQRYVHNAPAITSDGGGATTSINVAENTTAVTTVAASDADAGTTLSYSITGGADAARFTINSATGALAFVAAPDREVPTDSNADNIYDVEVQASDGALTDTQAIWVTVTNVNEAPVITSLGGGASANINAAENAIVAFATTATDVDAGTTLTYSIAGGADAAHFSIDSTTGAVTFGAHDYEAPTDSNSDNIYDVIVQASDGALTDTQAIWMTVTNVNDNAPAITSGGGGGNASLNVAENTTAVTIVTSTDADAGTTLNYSIIGGADAARFAINPTTGALSFVAAPDRENPIDAGADNVYDVTVQVSDGSLVDTQAIAVTVTNVNDITPVITSDGGGGSASLNVAENTSTVTTVSASDGDAGTAITYSIAGGADAARFTIDSTTGVLTFATAPDREAPTDGNADNVYDVVVQASDGALTDTQSISVTVTNVNDNAPAMTSNGGGAAASVNVAENSTAVTTLVATDADAGTTLSYSITGGADAARFTIDGVSGVLAFAAAPNHENPIDAGADNIYDVMVQVSDGRLVDTQSIAVTVTDANDNTPLITSDGGGASAARSVAENGTAVTTVTASDADASATLSYSIAGGADAARFTIDAASGVLSFVAAPDFEAPTDGGSNNVYDVVVRVSDGGLIDTQAIAATVTNVDDNAPVITSDGGGATAARNVAENGSAVTTVAATDADVSSTVSYSIVGGADAARFTIDATTGVLRFVAAPDFEATADADANNVYQVVVQVFDGGLTDTQTITVVVGNLSEGPAAFTDLPFVPSPAFSHGSGHAAPAPAAAPASPAREHGPRAHASATASETAAPNAQRAITSTTRGLTGGSNFDRVTSREARATAGGTSTARKPSAAADATAATLAERRVALDDFIAQGVDDTVLKLDGGFQLLARQGSHRSSSEPGVSQGVVASQHDESAVATSIDIDTVRYAGVALSAGVVWWVTRAGGLVASMLATAPAWRHLDLLPVLAANDKREDMAEAVLDTPEEQVAQDMLER